MMANRGARSAEGAPRGTERHVPVLLAQMLHAIAARDGQSYIDATFGAGGYSKAILTAAPGSRVLAIDRDPTALASGRWLAEQYRGRLQVSEGRFGDLDRVAAAAGFAPADGVVLDVGVSSMQLDDPERGFSFQGDGPLDMRMSLRGPTAADVVNAADEGRLADILFHLGEEKSARAIARAIVARRHQRPIARTSELAHLVACVRQGDASSSSPSIRSRTGWSSTSSGSERRRSRTPPVICRPRPNRGHGPVSSSLTIGR